MRCNPSRWLWGLIPIAMLSWGTYYRERPHVEADLAVRALEALRAAGQPWAKVSVTGRDAIITGRASKDGEPKAALDTVRAVWGIRTVQLKTDLAGTPPPPLAIGPHALPAEGEATNAGAAAKAKEAADAEAAAKAKEAADAEAAAKAKEAADAEAAAKAKEAADAEAAAKAKEAADAEAAAKAKEAADAEAAAKAKEAADAEAAAKAKEAADAEAAAKAKEAADAEAAAKAKEAVDAEAAAKAKEAVDAEAAAKSKEAADAEAAAKAKEAADAEAAAKAKQEEEAAAAQKAKQQADMEAEAKADAERQKTEEAAKVKPRETTDATRACEKRLAKAAGQGVILFKRAKSDIDPKSSLTIARLAEIVKACPGMRVEVEGHTDSEGEPDRNQRLSERRARAVVRSLVYAGAPEDRLSSVGHGATQPVAPNNSPQGMARNRRIEFKVFKD
jgi:OOP family OmpA-OmpF porin